LGPAPIKQNTPLPILALLFGLGGLCMYRPVWSMDFGMHLASGRWMVEHQTVATTDVLTFTVAGEPRIVHEWLARVLLALGDGAFGIEGLKIAAAVLCGTAVAVFGHAMRRRGMSLGGAVAACLLIVWLFESRFRLRPHLVTFLGAAVLLAQPPLPWSRLRTTLGTLFFVVWVNCHGGWILVPLHLACLSGLALVRREPWRLPAVAMVGAALVSLVNPRGWLLPLSAVRVSEVSDLIPEWASAFALGGDFRAKAVVAALLVLFSARAVLERHRTTHELAPLLWTQPLGLLSQRFLFLQPAALPMLGRTVGHRVTSTLGLGCLIPVLLITQGLRWSTLARTHKGPFASWAPDRFPESCATWLRQNRATEVISPAPWSGYLLAEVPGVRVAIDGRVELFGRSRAEAVSELFARPGADWPAWFDAPLAVLPRNFQHDFLKRNFSLVHVGKLAVVWQRR
jgi:hypothetical protein